MSGAPAPEDNDRPANGLDRLDRAVRTVRHLVARSSPRLVRRAWKSSGRAINRVLPKGLLGRSMLIILIPMLILLGVLTGVFMIRHTIIVTERLSDSVAGGIVSLSRIADSAVPEALKESTIRTASQAMYFDARLDPNGQLNPFWHLSDDIVHQALATGLSRRTTAPFTVRDAPGDRLIEVKMQLASGTLTVVFGRSLAFAYNWHLFLVWMVITAVILIIASLVFLRNQIKPIERLAAAAEAFGRGRPVEGFVPTGAREVRQAAQAFIGMRRRIERQIEQRTTMLAGVGHDLKTILTRFRLGVALIGDDEDTAALAADISEMEAMLEAYVDFARGDADEVPLPLDVEAVLGECLRQFTASSGRKVELDVGGIGSVTLRPTAFRRLIANLVGNAVRYGLSGVWIGAERREGWLTITVDDDGPGIPEDQREAVFRPFYRLDAARNQDVPGTGLGLAIARDAARNHGGDIELGPSPRGGLRATVRLPV